MSSRLTAALLAAGIALPTVPAVFEIPVIGPAVVQAYNGLPAEVKNRVPESIRAQLVPPSNAPQGAPGQRAPQGNPAAIQAQLDALVHDVQARHGGRATVSVAGASTQFTAGDNRPEPAFSTMKVPSGIIALRNNPATYGDVEASVIRSDNPASYRLNAVVPGPALNDVIAEAGSRTTNTAAWRMGTMWTTSDQAQFASGLRCVAGHEPVLEMMGRIIPEQRWGIGRIPGARFKGGWNFYEGGHLARQFGLIPGPNGDVAVAITAYNPRGYQSSYAMLNDLADGLSHMTGQLPTSRC